MNKRTALTVVTISIWVICACSTAWGIVDIRAIEAVREKSVLNSSDLNAIDAFVKDAVDEVLRAQSKDFATMAKNRAILTSRINSNIPNQKQYTQQFIESTQKHITSALKEAGTLPQAMCTKVRINLLIMANTLNKDVLATLGLPYLSDPSQPVSYWATRLTTGPSAIALVNSGKPQAAQIISAVNQQAAKATGTTLGLIVSFATQVTAPEGQSMILAIADTRLKQYAANTVTHELVDTKVLEGLCVQFHADGPNKTQCAQRFGQLFSYVIQRYVKGQATLSDAQKQALISVIAETEDKCVAKLVGEPLTGLRRSIEREDMDSLMNEHDKLLGSATQTGQLPDLLHYSYKQGSQTQDYPVTLR